MLSGTAHLTPRSIAADALDEFNNHHHHKQTDCDGVKKVKKTLQGHHRKRQKRCESQQNKNGIYCS